MEPLEIEHGPVPWSPMLLFHSALHQMGGMRMGLVISSWLKGWAKGEAREPASSASVAVPLVEIGYILG